jgi:hypothetical protein
MVMHWKSHQERLQKIRRLIRRLQLRIATDPRRFLIYSVLRFLVIVTMVVSFFLGQYENVALCLLALILFIIPAFAEENFKIEIPVLFESTIYIFIYAAAILGEIQRFYVLIPGWDTMLHTMNGFLCAVVGFSLIDLLNKNSSKIHLSPTYVVVAAFCFSMTVGVLWEFCEFFVDILFYADMQNDTIVQTIGTLAVNTDSAQKATVIPDIVRTVIYTKSGNTYVINGGYLDIGIIDTMKDLFVNMIGAIAFSVIGYNYIVRHPENSLAPQLEIRPETPEEAKLIEIHVDTLEKLSKEKKHVDLSAIRKEVLKRFARRWPRTARRLEVILDHQQAESGVAVTAWAAFLFAAASFILLYPFGSIFMNVFLVAVIFGMMASLLIFLFGPETVQRRQGLWLWTYLSVAACLLSVYKWLSKPVSSYADIKLCIVSILIDLGLPLLLWHQVKKNMK